MVYAQAVRILDRTHSDNSTEYRKMGNYFPNSAYVQLQSREDVKRALGTGIHARARTPWLPSKRKDPW